MIVYILPLTTVLHFLFKNATEVSNAMMFNAIYTPTTFRPVAFVTYHHTSFHWSFDYYLVT
jgi:hypothetical protein